jgi:shikimate dehydrogenase
MPSATTDEDHMPELRLPIIGSSSGADPAEQVLRAAFATAGVEVAIERWEPRPHRLPEVIAELKSPAFLGALVAAPYKERAASAVTAYSENARVTGALNGVAREGARRLRGQNTDVDGVRAGLSAILPKVQGKWPRTAMVLGAGGGARAVVAVLITGGFQRVAVFNRHLHKAEAVVTQFARSAKHLELRARPWHETILEAELGRVGLVVNASGVGMGETTEPSPLQAEWLPEGLYLLDLVLHASSTPLMREVADRGGTVANGQASFLTAHAALFRIWTGRDAPMDAMRTALASALGIVDAPAGSAGN